MVDTPSAGSRLYDRVAGDHRKSIEQATNLDIKHFYCRMLVLNAVWVPLTESALIARYVPIWNSIVPGFGNHDPGAGRKAGKDIPLGHFASWKRSRNRGGPNGYI